MRVTPVADHPLWAQGPAAALPGLRALVALPAGRAPVALPAGRAPVAPAAWRAPVAPAALPGPRALAELPARRDRWLLGVALGALGAYAEAAEVLRPLQDGSAGPGLRSLALSTLGSHARQTGRPAVAAALDARAWQLAVAAPRTALGLSARADASAGLVADAVAAGDPVLAAHRLASAGACVSAAGTAWRPRVRWLWVAAETALAQGRPKLAGEHAGRALAVSATAAAARHVTKSRLIRGVAAATAGAADAARLDLEQALEEATRLALPTLVWPTALVLAGLLDDDPAGAGRMLDRAVVAARAVHRGLGATGPERGAFAADPVVRRLLRPA